MHVYLTLKYNKVWFLRYSQVHAQFLVHIASLCLCVHACMRACVCVTKRVINPDICIAGFPPCIHTYDFLMYILNHITLICVYIANSNFICKIHLPAITGLLLPVIVSCYSSTNFFHLSCKVMTQLVY